MRCKLFTKDKSIWDIYRTLPPKVHPAKTSGYSPLEIDQPERLVTMKLACLLWGQIKHEISGAR